ncbi:MAG: Ku protein [Gammaproteobacteria bacterium]
MISGYMMRVMAMRSLASATISFGLVSIPVKLFTSYESSTYIHFNQINKKDGARVKQQLVSAKTGEPVAREDIVKGYEFAKGQYVLFTDEELGALEQKATHTIDIAEFVVADKVPRIYLDRVYYLGPDKGGARAYRLLAQALHETGRAALAQYAARGKQYLVLVRPQDDGLVMEQLRYASEIRPFSEVQIGDASVNKDELKLAVQLIDQAKSDEFQPEKYKDAVRERMLELIQRKVEGEDISVTAAEEPEHKIIDMMEALRASLAAGKREAGAKRKPPRRVTKKAAASGKSARRR